MPPGEWSALLVGHQWPTVGSLSILASARANRQSVTKQFEASQPKPWTMGQAPPDYLRTMVGAVVGVEIQVSRLVGKWKLSQNRLPIDRDGAAAGLMAAGEPNTVAIAELVRRASEGIISNS